MPTLATFMGKNKIDDFKGAGPTEPELQVYCTSIGQAIHVSMLHVVDMT
jgi:hypothetical protein